MHTDDGRGLRDSREASTHRVTARGAAGDAALGDHVTRRDDKNDSVAGGARNGNRVIHDALRADLLVLLGAPDPRPCAAGDHDGPHNLSCGEGHDRRG